MKLVFLHLKDMSQQSHCGVGATVKRIWRSGKSEQRSSTRAAQLLEKTCIFDYGEVAPMWLYRCLV